MRFIKFLITDVIWVGLKFYIEIPKAIWRAYKEKYPQ